MSLDEYVLCPPLTRWLPDRLGERVGCMRAPGRAVPRALRAVCRALCGPEGAEPPWTGLVVAGVLDDPMASLGEAALARLAPGGVLADLCVLPRRGLRGWLSSPARATQLRRATAERLTAWLALGLFDLEQWVAVEPPDVVVTLGRRRA